MDRMGAEPPATAVVDRARAADRPAAGPSGWATTSRALGRWFAPVADPATWHAAAYLGVGVVATLVWFLAVGFALLAAAIGCLVVVGIPLLIPCFGIVARCSALERERARMIDLRIPARPVAIGAGLRTRLAVLVRDGARWRQVAYHTTALFVAVALGLIALGTWGAALYLVSLPLWGWAVGLSVLASVALALLGVLGAGLAARVTLGTARLAAGYTRWLLGPDRYSTMRTQVEALTADRRQILDAIAGERRRIERNLHDGVQARLVALGIDLGLAEAMLPERADEAKRLLGEARDKTRASIGELRVIGRGLHPAILEDRGLDAALSAIVAAAPIPIRLRCELDPPAPPAVEEAAYFIVGEAVSNVLKHSGAQHASIDVASDGDALRIAVHDDGRGGADTTEGTGLAGIDARVRGLAGTMRIASPPGGPTLLAVELPFADAGGRVWR